MPPARPASAAPDRGQGLPVAHRPAVRSRAGDPVAGVWWSSGLDLCGSVSMAEAQARLDQIPCKFCITLAPVFQGWDWGPPSPAPAHTPAPSRCRRHGRAAAAGQGALACPLATGGDCRRAAGVGGAGVGGMSRGSGGEISRIQKRAGNPVMVMCPTAADPLDQGPPAPRSFDRRRGR